MYIKKIFSIILVLAIILSLGTYAFAEDTSGGGDIQITDTGADDESTVGNGEETDLPDTAFNISVDEKADILNKLGILSGDGKGNYSLDSQLKRSEAATFIVKMLGMDSYISSNKSKFQTTTFKDVKKSDWFVTYVSYCQQNNIISGYSDGTFGPDKTVTEKAFLAMLLKCLGYTSEAGDFTWGNIYNTSYNLNLVEGIEYENKTDDNSNFTRSDVVELLYKALSLKVKDKSVPLIQHLVNQGKLKKDAAIVTGFFQDTAFTQINSINTQSATRIEIVFNEEIHTLQNSDISVSRTGNSTKLASEIISQTINKVIIKTDKQIEKADYTLSIANVTDSEGNISTLTAAFKGYKLEAKVSDYFKISMIENVSEKEINVYFTHPVNENSETAQSYTIYEEEQEFAGGSANNISVKIMGWAKNGVTITLKNSVFKADKEYKLKIAGNLVSAYGTNLCDGLGDEGTFIPNTSSSTDFNVTSINATSGNMVQINFNREVNPVIAQQIYMYSVTDYNKDPVRVTKAVVMDGTGEKGKSVSLTLDYVLEKGKTYNLMINMINDITKQYKIEEKQYTFSGTYSTPLALKVAGVAINDSGMITVNFNKGIDPESATLLSNYFIFEMGNTYRSFAPDNISYDSSRPTQVKLYFRDVNILKKSTNYTLRVNPELKDYTGIPLDTFLEYNFYSSSIENTVPAIARAAIIGRDTIMVKMFKKDISLDSPNTRAQNYYMEYTVNGEKMKKIPIAVTYNDLDTVVLKFDSLDITQTYTLGCNEIRTYAGDLIKSDTMRCVVSLGQQ
jgi:hypothetical protein